MSGIEKFGEYEVQKRKDGSLFELGRGAMGVTYKAFDTDLHRFVALKTISPAIMAHPDAEERFIREARSAAQLRHPNIAAVYRRDKTPEGTHYYAMEFCEGQTIEQLVKQEGALDWRRALEIVAQVANALAAAARRNLIHRDIKPSNLMLVREDQGEDEVLKVIDFGLAKMMAEDGAAWSSIGTQGFVGTAHFASPEQIQNRIVDTRTDIYSLGATLWFMLLGSPPFAGSVWEVISKHVTATPDFSLLSAAPEKVVNLIREMMAKNPADRPQTARELLDKIKQCLHPAPDAEPGPDAAPALATVLDARPTRDSQPAAAGWAPSLRDLLRARGLLEPVEALRLGEALAAILDEEDPGGASLGALPIHGISIHFRIPLPECDARAKLREPVTAWPRFDLAISVGDNLEGAETAVSGGMVTIFAGGDPAGDRVQKLGRLVYELLGGVAGSQRAPLASLNEKGNDVLQCGIVEGQREYPRARDFIDAFGAAMADISGPRPGSHRELTVSCAEPESPLYSHKPLPVPHSEPSVSRVESESRRYSYKPRPTSRREPTVSRPEKKAHISTGKKRTIVIPVVVGAAVALTSFVVFAWKKLPFHGRSPAHADNSASTSVSKVTWPSEPEKRAVKTPLTATSTPKQVVKADPARSATKKSPFVNSLRMEFVPAGTRGVLFCRTDTRVRDFRQYAEETNFRQTGGIYVLKLKTNMDASHSLEWGLDSSASWEQPGFSQTEDDPVVGVSWSEAREFCEWLSKREGRTYRLPTDEEWSAAVGSGVYPWGSAWPPPNETGNYADLSFLGSLPGHDWKNELGNYVDFYPRTSPAGRYKANAWGLFDMGGNVWQWCEDKYRASMNDAETLEKYPALRKERASDGTPYRVVRGGSWDIDDPIFLRSTFRNFVRPASRGDAFGFRCVLVIPGA